MSQPTPSHDRKRELLAEQALFGLRSDEERELAALSVGEQDADELPLAAAALDLALHPSAGGETMPEHLRLRVLSSLKALHDNSQDTGRLADVAPASGSSRSRVSRRELAAWLATAAAIAAAAYVSTRSAADAPMSVARLRDQLVALRQQSADKVVQVAWTRGEDPTSTGASGEVLWSPAQQQGVMEFRGLAANDPREMQYQLWIFDAERDERYPVDGGVFDIPAGQTEVLVPIRARLPVSRVTLFAVSVEKPGGVVVSDRSRLPLVAPVKSPEP